jgi:ribosome-associated protein
MSIDNKIELITKSLEESKAENIVTIDLKNKSSFADYMIIASGNVNKHVYAIASRLSEDLKKYDIYDVQIEGKSEANWILVDIGNIIVNIFKKDVREYYNIEEIWSQNKIDLEIN